MQEKCKLHDSTDSLISAKNQIKHLKYVYFTLQFLESIGILWRALIITNLSNVTRM